MTRREGLSRFGLGVLTIAGWLGGCRNDSETPKSRVLSGRVVSIDAETGVLTGEFYIEKQQTRMNLSGKLAPDAEILINGMTAKLQDLRVDDSVKVEGWEEKRGEERNLIAKKVWVTRPTATRPSGTQPPNTAPSGG
ncbi:MAG: hypothetical protein HRF43_14290 [Phycisphaerae bacterium]|jgi:hypothetical protein